MEFNLGPGSKWDTVFAVLFALLFSSAFLAAIWLFLSCLEYAE
jgi:hypothetical protein